MAEKEFTGASFNQFLAEEKLMASRCKGCGALFLPPRPLCIKCYSREMTWEEMRGKGKLATFTVIAIAPTLMVEEGHGRDNPHCVGIVELEEGVSISARILGVDTQNPEKIKVGTPLRVEFLHKEKEENSITYLAFKPI